jgi:hypothetical protein
MRSSTNTSSNQFPAPHTELSGDRPQYNMAPEWGQRVGPADPNHPIRLAMRRCHRIASFNDLQADALMMFLRVGCRSGSRPGSPGQNLPATDSPAAATGQPTMPYTASCWCACRPTSRRDYVQRQHANGRTKKEILRLLKRAIAREISDCLPDPPQSTTTATTACPTSQKHHLHTVRAAPKSSRGRG